MPLRRTLAAVAVALLLPAGAGAFTPQSLYDGWPASRFVPTPAPCLRPAELGERIEALAAGHPGEVTVEVAGRSVQGRAIHLLTVGRGERKVLLWSQMHGDEPSATPALLDLLDYLLSHGEDPDTRAILDGLTLLVVPMLNPDGAEVYTRRNAQGIDINRDALNLATPEGRLLERLRAEHRPVLGFNLHDQNRRRTAGDTGVLATNAVLAVTGDAAGTVTPGRLRARRAGAAVAAALAPFAPGGMARYDDEWSPRSFGDNITARGTPVLLIESGGVPGGGPLSELTRLNYVGILVALRELARDDLAAYDPDDYVALPENNIDFWNDVIVRGGEVVQPGAGPAYRADVAFDLLRSDRVAAGCDDSRRARSEIVDLGDARLFAAGREVDATGRLLLAPFRAGAEGWSARRWLDADALARLAALGVAEMTWSVPERHFVAADRLASDLNGAGRSRLRVVAGSLPAGLLRLRRAPEAGAAPTLAAVFERLSRAGGSAEPGALDVDTTLRRLWGVANGAPARPVLAPDRPASFLVVEPTDGALAAGSAVTAVWIDGVELGAAGR